MGSATLAGIAAASLMACLFAAYISDAGRAGTERSIMDRDHRERVQRWHCGGGAHRLPGDGGRGTLLPLRLRWTLDEQSAGNGHCRAMGPDWRLHGVAMQGRCGNLRVRQSTCQGWALTPKLGASKSSENVEHSLTDNFSRTANSFFWRSKCCSAPAIAASAFNLHSCRRPSAAGSA